MNASTARADSRLRSAVVAVSVLLLTAISFFWFPGHTILQSDTQIFIPILQHLENPAVLQNDIMAVRPHVMYTLYDECALLLRKLTGASFESILLFQQFVYRALGIWGLYLLGTGVGFGMAPSLVLTALASLGAAVLGPAVLTVEYEPVPRGFAMACLLLSIGTFAHGRFVWSAGAASVGFALHPPTVLAYCAILGGVLVWKRDWRALAVLGVGPAAVFLSLIGQPPSPEKQTLFTRIDPELERLQRMRAPYNWVSLWFGRWWKHYAILTIVLAAAFMRIRDLLPPMLRITFLALPLIGWISVPVSYLFLEQMKWALIPQYQPARHLLFITFFAVIGCSMAAIWAAVRKRYPEAFAFCLVPLLVPQETDLSSISAIHFALAAGVALVVALGMTWRKTAVVAALVPYLAIPTIGGVENYPDLHSPELNELAEWARTSTPPDAVFQFADAGRQLTPGVFRARSRRALFADWKGGGQLNFLRSFGLTWGERWEMVHGPRSLSFYAELGIDYVVFSKAKAPSGAEPVFANAGWVVFRARE